MGIEWYRGEVRARGVNFEPPDLELDYGPRRLHYGWTRQESDGKLSYGTFLETGRIIDGQNGQLKKMVRHMLDAYEGAVLFTTPNQDIIFAGIDEAETKDFESELRGFGYGLRNGTSYSTLRTLSGACVGRDTCRLTYTDSEKFEPLLIDELESRWGHLSESVGVTGCERQCFRPATKTIGWVGSGLNLYALKIGGTEDGRHQGGPLIDVEGQNVYLHFVPRRDVPMVTSALFEFHMASASSDELSPGGMGYFFRRVGARGIIEWLQQNKETAELMKKTVKSPLASEPALANPSLLFGKGRPPGESHGDDEASSPP
jgi:sulfite reductase (NADPH) hemoprotein beta-component